jgi:hypothetical protein
MGRFTWNDHAEYVNLNQDHRDGLIQDHADATQHVWAFRKTVRASVLRPCFRIGSGSGNTPLPPVSAEHHDQGSEGRRVGRHDAYQHHDGPKAFPALLVYRGYGGNCGKYCEREEANQPRIKATAGVVPAGGGCSSRVGLEAESAAFVVISVSPSLADSLAEAYLSGCVYWLDDAAAESETGRSVPSSEGHDPPELHGCRALN